MSLHTCTVAIKFSRFAPRMREFVVASRLPQSAVGSRTANSLPCPSSRFFFRHTLGALTGICLLAGGASIAQIPDQLPGSTGKGPIGWDSYRRPDLFPKLRSGTET